MTEIKKTINENSKSGVKYWEISGFFVISILLVSLILLCFPLDAYCGDMYKYKDERGVIHIVGNIEDVPQKYRKKAALIKGGNVTVTSDKNTDGSKKIDNFLRESKKSMDKPTASIPLIIFFESWSSRLLFSGAIILITFFVLLFGLYLTFDLPERNDRVKFKILLVISWMFMTVFFWSAMGKTSFFTFTEGCSQRAGRAVSLTGSDKEQREALLKFKNDIDVFSYKVSRLIN